MADLLLLAFPPLLSTRTSQGRSRRETAELIGTANVDWVLRHAASPAARPSLSRPTLHSLAQRLILSEQIGPALCEAAALTGTVDNCSDHFSQPDAPGHQAWLDWQFPIDV